VCGRKEEKIRARVDSSLSSGIKTSVAHKGDTLSLILTPDSEQRGQLHAVAEDPAEGDHGSDPVPSVDSRVHAVVRDHHVSMRADRKKRVSDDEESPTFVV
jgi:hypothetical protein